MCQRVTRRTAVGSRAADLLHRALTVLRRLCHGVCTTNAPGTAPTLTLILGSLGIGAVLFPLRHHRRDCAAVSGAASTALLMLFAVTRVGCCQDLASTMVGSLPSSREGVLAARAKARSSLRLRRRRWHVRHSGMQQQQQPASVDMQPCGGHT